MRVKAMTPINLCDNRFLFKIVRETKNLVYLKYYKPNMTRIETECATNYHYEHYFLFDGVMCDDIVKLDKKTFYMMYMEDFDIEVGQFYKDDNGSGSVVNIKESIIFGNDTLKSCYEIMFNLLHLQGKINFKKDNLIEDETLFSKKIYENNKNLLNIAYEIIRPLYKLLNNDEKEYITKRVNYFKHNTFLYESIIENIMKE